MEINEFRQLFAAEVRSAIDWDLLEQYCAASLEIITDAEELGDLQTVWHVSSSGALSDWRDQKARRLTVSEAAMVPDIPTPTGARFINEIESEYRHGLHPRVWGIPLYQTKAGESLILDGNHRATALLRSGAPIRLLAAVAHGFDSADLLPDLLRDTAGNVGPTEWAQRVSLIEQKLKRCSR